MAQQSRQGILESENFAGGTTESPAQNCCAGLGEDEQRESDR
jgi:hypothetical protein